MSKYVDEFFKDEELFKQRVMGGGLVGSKCTAYYEGIAEEVIQLIRSNPRIKNRFVEHTEQFLKMVDTYEAAFKKLRKRRRKTYLPKDFSPDPRNWFLIRKRLSSLQTNITKNIIPRPYQTRPPTEQEHLMCCYVRLIVIHDCLHRPPGYIPIYFNQANNVPALYFNVALQLWSNIAHGIWGEIEKEAKELSDEALRAVKVDLLKQTTDTTTQKNTTGQNSRKKARATKQEKENREAAILKACYDLKEVFHANPTTKQVAKETGFSQAQIRNSKAYKDGRIAKKTAVNTTENIHSATSSEYFNDHDNMSSQKNRESKQSQAEIDRLVEEQGKDSKSKRVL